MINKNIFSQRLKTVRETNQLTQAELAKKLNVSKQTISNWETSSKLPSVPVLANLSEVLNVSMDFLLGKSDINNIDVTGLSNDEIFTLTALVSLMKKSDNTK